MSTAFAIRTDDLSKQYAIACQPDAYHTLRDSLASALTAPWRLFRGVPSQTRRLFWALDGVSFEVERGETVGVIGRNGAGKSTLLKILSRITQPTRGQAEIRGRLASLLEIGTGFHRELTGRENIFLYGAILGMKRGEIRRKFDAIVEFSGVDTFLDTPVRHYSSGMHTRLAFSVAAHLEPEILLIDEVLSVGDVSFQQKCVDRMGELVAGDRTILIVSHHLHTIQNLCRRCLVLADGRITFFGPTDDAIKHYLASLDAAAGRRDLRQQIQRRGNGRVQVTAAYLVDRGFQQVERPMSGEDIGIVLEYEWPGGELSRDFSVHLGLREQFRNPIIHFCTETTDTKWTHVPRSARVVCRVPRLPLAPGRYFLDVFCIVDGDIADWVSDALHFDVIPGDFFGTGRLPPEKAAVLLVDHHWEQFPLHAAPPSAKACQ